MKVQKQLLEVLCKKKVPKNNEGAEAVTGGVL